MHNTKGKILIVDDDKPTLMLVKDTLKDCNLMIATAVNGKMALAKAKTNRFDLILLDIHLPDMDGYAVCERLKMHPATFETPIIFLTVNRDIESLSRGFDAGAVDYITKPFHPHELKKRIELHINERNYRRFLKDKSKQNEQKKQDIALFISTLGHELRNPLNSILGFSEILKSKEVTAKERITYANYINQSGNILFKLLNDIIDISKIESGKLNIEKADILINKELSDIKKLYDGYLKSIDKKIEIKLNTGIDDPKFSIKTDLLRLNQIFRNLIDNAINYSESNIITFGYDKTTASKIRFYVSDNGIGINEELQKKIFKYFERGNLEDITNKSGKGLGLAICRNLVHHLGGAIKVKSRPGHGTTFYFTLPLDEGNAGNDKPEVINEINWEDKTILIAEDVKVNFLFLSAALKRTKATLLHAKDGMEAINTAREKKPDIILMDMIMPGISGLQATMEIRKFDPLVPIIAQTGFDSGESRDNLLKAGCNDILQKPVKPRMLLGIISKYID